MRQSLRKTRCNVTRGMSLVELMLAIGILGIGLICIAAVFPAGIAQTDEAVDDVMGPIVANNALSVIRSKVTPEMFGTRDEAVAVMNQAGATVGFEPTTAAGDWFWRRPSLFDPPGANNTVSVNTELPVSGSVIHGAGAVSVFGNPAAPLDGFDVDGETLGVMPWNTQRNANGVPSSVILTQGERSYPMINQLDGMNAAAGYYGNLDPSKPLPPRARYLWDCMFRRYDGKILVAIFVYRVIDQSRGSRVYWSQVDGQDLGVRHLNLEAQNTAIPAVSRLKLSDVSGDVDSALHRQLREALDPGQWVIDQNNIVHRPLNVWQESGGEHWCEFRSPIPIGGPARVNHYKGGDPAVGAVTNLWYLPLEVEVQDDNAGNRFVDLVPVYATVREL